MVRINALSIAIAISLFLQESQSVPALAEDKKLLLLGEKTGTHFFSSLRDRQSRRQDRLFVLCVGYLRKGDLFAARREAITLYRRALVIQSRALTSRRIAFAKGRTSIANRRSAIACPREKFSCSTGHFSFVKPTRRFCIYFQEK